MWTERTGLIRWTTATIASAKADCGRDYQPLIGKRQQRLRRDVGPREHGNSIREGTDTTSNWSINRATSQVSRVLEGRHFRAVLVRNRSNVRSNGRNRTYVATKPHLPTNFDYCRNEPKGRVVGMRYSGWGIPDIGLDGQRIRAAPKAPLRKRPTPFPERCPSILFIFKKRQRVRSPRDPACCVG